MNIIKPPSLVLGRMGTLICVGELDVGSTLPADLHWHVTVHPQHRATGYQQQGFRPSGTIVPPTFRCSGYRCATLH